MTIVFTCVCRKSIEVSEEFRGKQVRCPFCDAVVVAPQQPLGLSPSAERSPAVIAPALGSRKRLLLRGEKRTRRERSGYPARHLPTRHREREYDEREQRRYDGRPHAAGKSPAIPVIIGIGVIALIAVVLYFAGGGSGAKYPNPRAAIEYFLDAMREGRTLDAGACLDPGSSDQSPQSAINFLSGKLNTSTNGKELAYTLIEPDVDWERGTARAEVRISFKTQDKGELIVVNPVFSCVRRRGYWYVFPR